MILEYLETSQFFVAEKFLVVKVRYYLRDRDPVFFDFCDIWRNTKILGIQHVYANPEEFDYKPLDPESDDIIPFQVSLPSDYDTGKAILKAFGVIEPTNFRWQAHSALGQPSTKGSITLRSSARSPAIQLEKSVSDMNS